MMLWRQNTWVHCPPPVNETVPPELQGCVKMKWDICGQHIGDWDVPPSLVMHNIKSKFILYENCVLTIYKWSLLTL